MVRTEKVRKRQAAWYKRNKKRILKSRKVYYKEHKQDRQIYEKTPERKFTNYKWNAKNRKLRWSLTFEQFIQFWQKPCYYCGEKIDLVGLDRIDNNKGYNMENVVSCCEWCNRMKLKYSKKDFIKQCKKIANKHK